MNYIYDILLNFTSSKKVYDFFEWDTNDKIFNIKKIPIFKVSKNTLKDILNFKIKIEKSFLDKIDGSSIVYKKSKRKFRYLVVVSDGSKALGISMNDYGIVEYRSNMLLDEEEEALLISSKLPVENIEYKKLEKFKKDEFITRKEIAEKEFLCNEINSLYNKNDLEKLQYLYIEYFNMKTDNIEQIYSDLMESLSNIDDRHLVLYNLLKLSYKR